MSNGPQTEISNPFKELLSYLMTGVLLWDVSADPKLVYANDAAKTYFKIDWDSHLGKAQAEIAEVSPLPLKTNTVSQAQLTVNDIVVDIDVFPLGNHVAVVFGNPYKAQARRDLIQTFTSLRQEANEACERLQNRKNPACALFDTMWDGYSKVECQRDRLFLTTGETK